MIVNLLSLDLFNKKDKNFGLWEIVICQPILTFNQEYNLNSNE